MSNRRSLPKPMARPIRLTVVGSTAFAFLAASLMLLSPASASVTSGVVIIAPYTHVGASIQVSSGFAGCGKFTVQKQPKWAPKTGTFRTSATSNASGCQSPGLGTEAQWYTYLDLSIPVTITANRSYTVNETWALNMLDSWAVTPYTHCKLNYAAALSECLATASVELYTYTIFEDLTNYTITFSFVSAIADYATVENYSQLSCVSTPCTPIGGNYSFGSGTGLSGSNTYVTSIYNNFTTPVLNASHAYEVYVTFLVETDSEVELDNAKAKGTPSAEAKFNMGSLGNGALLRGIKIA